MRGLDFYKTKSGLAVARVHYSADPDKDPLTDAGRKWLQNEIVGIKGGLSSSSWRKEMEIDFSARNGQRVFEGIEEIKDKIFVDPFTIPEWWEVRSGYDWGKRNPFAYEEISIDGDGNIYFCFEAYGAGREIGVQAELIKKSPRFHRTVSKYADPSIWTEDQVAKDGSYTSLQKLFQEKGIVFQKGKTDDVAFVERLESAWFDFIVKDDGSIVKIPKKEPKVKIFKTCPCLWDELVDLRWDEFSPVVEENKGKKEQIIQTKNHAFDAGKYAYLSLPQASVQPKPRSRDQAFPMAQELLKQQPKSEWEKWNQ